MQTLDQFLRGLPDGPVWLTGKKLKELLAILIADRPRAGTNLTETPSDKGRIFQASGGGEGAALEPAPFDLTLFFQGTSPKIRLRPGKVNERVATNVLATLSPPSQATLYVYADVTTNGKKVQSFELKADTAAPTPPDPTISQGPGRFPALLHMIVYTPADSFGPETYTPYRLLPRGNVRALLKEVLRASTSTPAPGKMTYDPYYGWDVTTDVTEPDVTI